MEERKKKRKIIIVILLILLFLIFSIIFLFGSKKEEIKKYNGTYEENLYNYLIDNEIGYGEINDEFLNENNLYDEEFICKRTTYSNGLLEFIDCEIDGEIKDYCTYDGSRLLCNILDKDSKPNAEVDVDESLFNENDFANKDFDINVNIEEKSDLNIKDILYCVTTSDKCVPNISAGTSFDASVKEDGINRVCYVVNYTNDSSSEIICTDEYKLDKVAPTIIDPTFIGDKGLNGWYTSDVSILLNQAIDNFSGISDTSIDKNIINYETDGEKVTVTAIDKAGNTSSKTYTVKIDKTAPLVEDITLSGTLGTNGWYRSDVEVAYENGVDSLSGHDKTSINTKKIDFDTDGYEIILTSSDKAGNTTIKKYPVKVDTTKPIISGIADIRIDTASTFDLLEGVTAFDTTSGINGSITTSINSINTNIEGDYTVSYMVVDNAGNSYTATRTITVADDYPTVLYTVLSEPFNEYGWANENFDVRLVLRSIYDSKIVSAKYCTTTSDNCTPDTDLDINNPLVTISSESETNKICATTTLENGNNSGVVCSDTYKLDKTAPTSSNIVFTGDIGNNNIYTSNVNISYTEGNDNLSGYLSSNLSKTLIDYDQLNETIYITTTDKAGNKTTTSKKISVDRTVPVINGVTDTVVRQGSSVSLTSGISVTDSTSGVEGNYTYSPTNVNTNIVGEHEVIYTATDKAGNTTSITRKIIVDNFTPIIKFTTFNSAMTSYGWSNRDIQLSVSYSGLPSGTWVDHIEYCTTTNSSCTPDKTVNLSLNIFLLQEESENIKGCSHLVLNDGSTSNVVCSSTYKIDKTAPIVQNPVLTGNLGLNDYYTSDVKIVGYDVYDELSGLKQHISTHTEIKENTNSEIVTITATDKAGNNTVYDFEVKIDKTKPTAGSIVINSEVREDGWYDSDVEISALNGTDNESGHLKTVIDYNILNASTSGTEIEVTTTDRAGNTNSIVEVVKIDKKLPVVGSLTLDGVMGANGWYTSDVTINKTDDINSGEVDIIKLSNDTAGTTLRVISRDINGIEKIDAITLKIDKKTPTLTIKDPVPKVIVGEDFNTINLFEEPDYGISGGTTLCDITTTKDLPVGEYKANCTITGTNGLSSSSSVTFEIVDKTYDEVDRFIDGANTTNYSYVKTGIKPGSDTKIDMSFTIVDTKPATTALSKWVFSSRIGYQNQMMGVAYSNSESLLQYNNSSINIGASNYVIGEKNHITLSNEKLTHNGTTYSEVSNTYWKSIWEMYLFGNNEANRLRGTTNGDVVIHHFKVYEEEELIMDAVPAILNNGTTVMFDKVTNTYLTTIGTLIPVE